jgi:hypothetical protein
MGLLVSELPVSGKKPLENTLKWEDRQGKNLEKNFG